MIKTTKEQLIKDLAKMEEKYKASDEYQTWLRKEFAKAFGWSKKRDLYDLYQDKNRGVIDNPTWPEIFVEVGRLLQRDTTLCLKDDIEKVKEGMNLIAKIIDDNEEIFINSPRREK